MLISKKKSLYQKLFLSMIDAFEITLRFLDVVVVKEYLDTNKPNDDFKKLLIEKLFKKMSLGDWLSIFRDGSRFLVEEENLFFPKLNSYAIKKDSGKPKNAKIMESYDTLINVRNKFKGYSTNCTEKEYHDLYDECIPHMEAICGGLSFLADYEYLAVKTTKGEQVFHVEFEDYTLDELCEITKLMLSQKQMSITEEAMDRLRSNYEVAMKSKDYGNGRFVRKMLEEAEMNLAERILEMGDIEFNDALITTLEASDIEEYKVMEKNEKISIGFAC